MNTAVKIRILCVDDEDMIRANLSDYLEDSGYAVIQAANGNEGILKYRDSKPDIILADVRMPEMDGFQLISAVRALDEDIPIIVISGTGLIQDVVDALRLGAWDYITKPVEDMAIVEHSIKKAIEKKLLLAENKLYRNNLEKLVEVRTKALNEEIENRNKAEEALKSLNEELESRVRERTVELEQSIITLKNTKDKLIQSEKLASLGVLVSGVAHEINTPLGVAVTATSYLSDIVESCKAAFESNNLKRKDLENFMRAISDSSGIIMKNLTRAAERVNSFKKLAVDQTSGEKRIFNVKEYLNDILESLHPKLKHTRHLVKIDCPDDIALNSYPGAYSQIITNLIFNSLIHGFDGVNSGIIEINIKKENNSIILLYKDDGIGMVSEDLARIYDPFFTTKRTSGGSGLGMNIVYNLVTGTLNGTIDCKSEPGKGVHFTLILPAEF